MKALISTFEPFLDGVRFVQLADEEFPVAPTLIWVTAPEAVAPETHYYRDGNFVEIPVPEPIEGAAPVEQPISEGAQTL